MVTVSRGTSPSTGAASQTQVDAIQAQFNALVVPTAATSTPPAVADASLLGSSSTMFARADHTHSSSVQSALLTVTGGAGQVTWTFPKPFATGVSPIILAVVQNVVGSTQPFIINLMGGPTNTSVTVGVFRTVPVTLPGIATSLLNFVVNQFSLAPNGTVVHILARAPN